MDNSPKNEPPPPQRRPLDYQADANIGCLLGGLFGLFGIPVLLMACGVLEYDGLPSMFALFPLTGISLVLFGLLGAGIGIGYAAYKHRRTR